MYLYRIILLFALFPIIASSQSFTTEDYYTFPINPGQTNYLAGTMGEMRGTHFHGGIDVRTGGRIGLPVHAVADGYVFRIRVQQGGYGHSIYLKHPNGTTSVYAHLDRFEPALEQYLVDKQYEAKSYFVNLFPKKGEFSFRQGETIAYSGNTGSSSGPHLHFELRDEKQRVLDPLKFGFKEIIDNLTPTLKRIAFVTLDENARVNGAFGRFEYRVYKIGDYYRVTKPIDLKGNIGIEIQYQDRHNGSGARNGIPEIIMTLDEDTVFHQRKTRISYNEMRNIVVHMNYKNYAERRSKFNRLYKEEGNQLSFYLKTNEGIFFDESTRNIQIQLIDSYGNSSLFDKNVNNRPIQYPISPTINDFEILENTMHIQSARGPDEGITVLANSLQYQSQPYALQKNNYYLWDLRDGLPDLVITQNKVLKTHFQRTIPSGQDFQFFHNDIQLSFGRRTLFDTLYLRFDKTLEGEREIFQFFHNDFPIRQNVEVTLKPEGSYDLEKAHAYSVYGSRLNFQGGEWGADGLKFNTRELVKFTIAEDHDAPTVTTIRLKSDKIILLIDDEMSGIKSYDAYMNGEWLLMKYDAKKRRLESRPRILNKMLEGEFILEVEDNAGNQRIYQKTITNL